MQLLRLHHRILCSLPRATIRNASTQGEKGVKVENMDSRMAIMRRILYPPTIKNTSTPTGAWRPNVLRALYKAIPSKQAHEIIERAFKLYTRRSRERRQAELERKFNSMQRAVTELARIDMRLAKEANKKDDPRKRTAEEIKLLETLKGKERQIALARIEGRLRGLFPRELRIPLDTPPTNGWNHEWRRP